MRPDSVGSIIHAFLKPFRSYEFKDSKILTFSLQGVSPIVRVCRPFRAFSLGCVAPSMGFTHR